MAGAVGMWPTRTFFCASTFVSGPLSRTLLVQWLLLRSNLHSADTSDAGELRTAERLMERALQLQRHPRMLEILHELQARLKAAEAGGGEL